MSFLPLIALLLPVITGGAIILWRPKHNKPRNIMVIISCIIVSLLVAYILYLRYTTGNEMDLLLIPIIENKMELALHVDGLSTVFAGIVALLWPITILYSFEYMKHEHNKNRFYSFFTITYGVVLGIAFAANLFTLYFFYELLTLCTLPLVMHADDGKSGYAGKKYLMFSMMGASFAFISMFLLSQYGKLDFILGGSLNVGLMYSNENFLRMAFLLGFFGFGVKAAVFPFHAWLPSAGVAPTPVTALLHAVAVVNAGLFAVLRIIYYNYGTVLIYNSWAQIIALSFTAFTIVFGSAMALRLQHLKRRMAYSTVSNLSYMLFAASLCTPSGLSASLLHMTVHSIVKITLFFCAGALLCQTHHTKLGLQEYVHQYEGYGKRMPFVFCMFTISSLALIGIPPFAGFSSKWNIAIAAVDTGFIVSLIGCAALICSAFLTGLYLIGVLRYAYFPRENFNYKTLEEITDPKWQMKTAFLLLLVCIITLSFTSGTLLDLFTLIATDTF